ncbi:MAG: extracellular solute-binding protein [Chloroflexi bacterium]|nr:extracellular solute-binding protein [Chloroflexota bacterium]
MKRMLCTVGVVLVSFILMACAGGGTPAPQSAPTQPAAAKPAAAPTQAAPAAKASPAAQAPAQPTKPLTAVEVAALPLGPERQRILEEGARREGTVTVYTTSTGFEPIAGKFMERYPFVKMEVFMTRAEDLTQRALAEAKAGRLSGDVIKSNVFVQNDLKDVTIKFNTPYGKFQTSPNTANLDMTGIVFTYSTQRVTAADVPQRVEDLLLPRWKQNVGLFAPPNSFPGRWVGALLDKLGEQPARDLLTKLADQKPYFFGQPDQGRNSLLAGEYDLNMQSINRALFSVKNGDPVGWVALDPTTLSPDSVGIFKLAQRPHAAMLFLDFVLSPEGQQMVADVSGSIAQDELDKGVKAGVKLPPPSRLHIQSTSDTPKLRGWMELYEKLVMKK